MRDKHYQVFSARLENKIVEELKNRRQNFKSWNLLFKQLVDNSHIPKHPLTKPKKKA